MTEQHIQLEATECLGSEGKVIVRPNPYVTDEFIPNISIQHSPALNTEEGDRNYDDLFKLFDKDEVNPPNLDNMPVLESEKERSNGEVTYLQNVQFGQEFVEVESDNLEEMFEQPVSPENPLSYLSIPTIKGNFDGLKNVRFTDDQAEIKASDASDSNVQHRRRSNVVTYILEEKYTGWLTCAILHSAPEYSKFPVTNFSSPSGVPFEIVENGAREVVYQEIAFPIRGQYVNAHAAFIYLENECSFDVKFTVRSTDRKNHGNKKEGKQWIFFVGPATKEAMALCRIPDLLYNKATATAIQVMVELRDPDRVKKNKRENCASIPLPDDGTDSPLQKKMKLAVTGYSKIVQKMTQGQLDAEIQKWNDLL